MRCRGVFGTILISLGVVAMARPAPEPLGQVASLKLLRNSNFEAHATYDIIVDRQRHGLEIPEHFMAAAVRHLEARRLKESVPAMTDFMPKFVQYITPIKIGSPPQQFNVELDTGMRDFWIYGMDTPREQFHHQKLYNPSASSTAQKLAEAEFEVQYGLDSTGDRASGDVYKDTIAIGNLTAYDQVFGAANNVSADLTLNCQLHGIMGLGINNSSSIFKLKSSHVSETWRPEPWIRKVQSLLREPLFTVNLYPSDDGTINFGYIDSKEHTEEPIIYTPRAYLDIVEWGFDSTGYAVGNDTFKSTKIPAIADTGTKLIYLFDEIVTDYYSNVKDARYEGSEQGYTFPCSAELPDFVFGVGSSSITVPGRYINYRESLNLTTERCFGAIQNGTNGWSIFGAVALQSALVIYDIGQDRIGWARKQLDLN